MRRPSRLFGDRFRWAYKEGYAAQYGDGARRHDPRYAVLLCQHGHIYPVGGTTLAASTNNGGPIAKRLMALPCTTVLQDGTDGVNVAFDLADFELVAEIMKPRVRRRLSAEQRKKLADAGASHRFKKRGAYDADAGLETTQRSSEGQTSLSPQTPILAPNTTTS